MAEAILKRWGGQDFNPYSAGVEPSCEARPHAKEFLRAHRIWHPDLRCKNYREFLAPEAPSMDFIISLGEHPPVWMSTVWPGHPKIIHWHISEPILNGSEARKNLLFQPDLCGIREPNQTFGARLSERGDQKSRDGGVIVCARSEYRDA
jgi:protein-tyrosine-phosphatase